MFEEKLYDVITQKYALMRIETRVKKGRRIFLFLLFVLPVRVCQARHQKCLKILIRK